MRWNRVRNVACAVLCGGMVFQTVGCGALAGSVVANVVSAVVTEAVLTGLPFPF